MRSPQRPGILEKTIYRHGMAMPRAGDLVERDYDFGRVVNVTITPAVGDGRPEELGAEPGEFVHLATIEFLPRCSCGFTELASCERHQLLTYAERLAAEALYRSPVEVGREGIGGFAAGQAEEVILALRIAGFPVDRDLGQTLAGMIHDLEVEGYQVTVRGPVTTSVTTLPTKTADDSA